MRRSHPKRPSDYSLNELIDILAGADPPVLPILRKGRLVPTDSFPLPRLNTSLPDRLSRRSALHPERRRRGRRVQDRRLADAERRAEKAEAELAALRELIRRGLRGL